MTLQERARLARGNAELHPVGSAERAGWEAAADAWERLSTPAKAPSARGMAIAARHSLRTQLAAMPAEPDVPQPRSTLDQFIDEPVIERAAVPEAAIAF